MERLPEEPSGSAAPEPAPPALKPAAAEPAASGTAAPSAAPRAARPGAPTAKGATGAECIPNIGPEGRRLRYIVGGVALGLGLIGSIRIIVVRLPPIEMFGPGLAFLAAALGYFQARDSTCVFLAATGEKDADAKGPKKLDKDQRARVRLQAWRVIVQAVGSALVVTAVAAAIASWRIG
jgi:hypothetical protein